MEFRHSITIKRPIEFFVTFSQNEKNDMLWQPSIIEAEKTSPGPWGVGATGREVRRFLGSKAVTIYEITEYQPGTRISMKSTSAVIPWEATYLWEPAEEGTKWTVIYRSMPTGLLKLLAPIFDGMFRNTLVTDMGRLKQILETPE